MTTPSSSDIRMVHAERMAKHVIEAHARLHNATRFSDLQLVAQSLACAMNAALDMLNTPNTDKGK